MRLTYRLQVWGRSRMAAVVFAGAFLLASCSPDQPQPRPITWDQYEQIIPGTSYSRVVSIVGQKGEEMSSIDLDGKTVRTYEFSSPTGNFLVQFADDIVINKIPGTIKAPPLSADQ